MMMKLVKQERHIEIVLNRPEALNALSTPMLKEIASVLKEAASSPFGIMVLRGEGRAFCVGGDIKERKAGIGFETYLMERILTFQEIASMLRKSDKVIIAALHGHVVGGGILISLYADLRIAAEGTIFRLPEIDIGSTLVFGGNKILADTIGIDCAKKLLFFGDAVGIEEALKIGLIHQIVPEHDLYARVIEFVNRLCDKSQVTLKLMKKAITSAGETGFEEMLLRETIDAAVNQYSRQNEKQ
jgi:enoyl-CoA hydratase/carnithine racemase